MDLINIGTVITTGAAIGSVVAALFAYNQKLSKDVLREANGDYKDRNAQLEDENSRYKAKITELENRIVALETEKRLPLDELTRLIVDQHSEQITSTENLTKQLASVATQMGKVVKALTKENSSENKSPA